jgi:5-methylthioadenosine/S-adenosylhomocysteine deaminase
MTRRLGVIFALSLCLASHAQVTVVRAGRLIDPDSATMLTDQEILIVGSKVAAVGKQLGVPKDANWIDLSDKTVLPGLTTTTRI